MARLLAPAALAGTTLAVLALVLAGGAVPPSASRVEASPARGDAAAGGWSRRLSLPPLFPAALPVGADREGRQGYLEDGLYTEALGPEQVLWRTSRAIGLPYAGRLVGGVRLPSQGPSFFTWDPVLKRSPNRGWRRFGTDLLLRRTLRALRDFSSANPSAPRIGIGDISRPRGGDFGPRFGGLGHASHQNGLDVDLYYPRRDGRERAPRSPRQVDRRLSQELVDHFLGAGAQRVFVGAGLGLKGPRRLVVALPNHDDHLHVRFSDPSRRPRRPRRSRGSADG